MYSTVYIYCVLYIIYNNIYICVHLVCMHVFSRTMYQVDLENDQERLTTVLKPVLHHIMVCITGIQARCSSSPPIFTIPLSFFDMTHSSEFPVPVNACTVCTICVCIYGYVAGQSCMTCLCPGTSKLVAISGAGLRSTRSRVL